MIPALLVALLFAATASAQPGPRLTDAQLFDALNLDHPGLGAVKTSVLASNYPAAKSNLTAYLQTRTNVNWTFDWRNPTTGVGFNRASADLLTNGTVNQVGYPYTFPGGDIDWWFNYTTDPTCGCVKNNEWQWTLNRMSGWPNLGATYWGTGDESYALAWSRQLRDWIAQCPAATGRSNGAPSTWRTIESGLRMSGSWPDSFFRFVLSPSLTNEEHVLYLKSSVEHARYLSNFYTSALIAPANFLTMEMNGLYAVGIVFPELKEATGWRNFAAQKLRAEQTNQFLPDGAHNELTPRYHGVALGNIANLYVLAVTNNRVAELPAGFVAGLEPAFEYYARLGTPERNVPAFNDSSREKIKSRFATGLSYFPTRTDFAWFATDGASGSSPAYTSFRFPWAGYGVMRSGWETNANYLCFDGGALGFSGHRHEDKLNVVLWGYGREFLFDNGGGPYDASIWRTWGMSGYSHNTVIVDSLDQEGGDGSMAATDADYIAQAPIDLRWESDLKHDFAAATFNRGFGGNYNNRIATHTRRVLFVKPDLFVIADTLVPTNTAAHTYQARWHVRATNTVLQSASGVVSTADAGLANLVIVPCLTNGLTVTNPVMQMSASGPGATNLAEILGWDLPDTTSTELPATSVTHTLSGTSTQQFLTVFMPLPPGATNPLTLVSNTGSTSAELWLNDGRRLRVSADPNPARGLKLTELLPGGTTNRNVGAGFQPPTFTGLTNRAMNPNTVKAMPFTVTDPDGMASNVVLSAVSLTPAVLPDGGVMLSGNGSNRVLTVTPPTNTSGVARLQLNASDPDGSTLAPDFYLTINAPPQTNGNSGTTWEGESVDVDLRGLLADDLTATDSLLLACSNAAGGNVTLLPDGRTARFVPATNFSGTATLDVVATDMGYDPRLLLYYNFEAPEDLGDGLVTDDADNLREATLRTNGTGSAVLDNDVPVALGVANLRSLRLFESGSNNVAALMRLVPTNEFNFNTNDWTFTGWFKRATQNTEDFIFYLGDGDGFGANEELQLHGNANNSTLNLRHYIGETNTDVNLLVSGVVTGQWYHTAVTFTRTNGSAGILRLYLNGALSGSGAVTAFNLPQNVPIVFGGHNRTNSGQNRWFSGWLDDLAIYTNALSAGEVAQLATRTVGHNAGLTSTSAVPVLVRDINDPPIALVGQTNTSMNQPVDVDLRTLATDIETSAAGLRFTVSPGANGSVVLLPDGYTARFTPAAGFNDGFASFTYSVTDQGVDSRALLHYAFEPPDTTTDAQATDATGNGRTGSLNAFGAGGFAYVTNVPGPLAAFDFASLQLTDFGSNGAARLLRTLDRSEWNLSDQDWTFSGWFRRAAQTNEDFIFYLGNGDGFGSNEELQLYGYSGAGTLGLRHYIGENLTDVSLSSSIAVGTWYHTAVTFTRTNLNTGLLRFYLNGALVGTATPTFNLDQSVPLVFGGHNNEGYAAWRWFNGQLDDVALFNAALTSNEVARLAAGTVAHFGGLSATNSVTVQVGTPNLPPTLDAVSNRTLYAGQTLFVTNAAADPNNPPQRLLFSLLGGPAGAGINATSGVVNWRPTLAQSGTNHLFTVRVTEGGWWTSLPAQADAFVRDGSSSNLNFGADAVLAVRLGGTGFTRETFLRFSLSNLPGSLAEARLQLTPTLTAAPAMHAVAFVTNDVWGELTLTWSNRPASGSAIATWSPQAGVPTDVPLTNAAFSALAADQLLSLRVFATNTAADRVEYGSREGASSNAPSLLVLTTNATSLSATQSFWVSVLAPVQPVMTNARWNGGAFSFTVLGTAGPDYLIQISTNLAQPAAWATPLSTNSPALPLDWTEPAAGGDPARFYRILLGP